MTDNIPLHMKGYALLPIGRIDVNIELRSLHFAMLVYKLTIQYCIFTIDVTLVNSV